MTKVNLYRLPGGRQPSRPPQCTYGDTVSEATAMIASTLLIISLWNTIGVIGIVTAWLTAFEHRLCYDHMCLSHSWSVSKRLNFPLFSSSVSFTFLYHFLFPCFAPLCSDLISFAFLSFSARKYTISRLTVVVARHLKYVHSSSRSGICTWCITRQEATKATPSRQTNINVFSDHSELSNR